MRIYQTWLKKHLVPFLLPQKGHILISQHVLQAQISTRSELGDHSRGLACPESSCLDLGILSASLRVAGCQSHRQGSGVGRKAAAEQSSRPQAAPAGHSFLKSPRLAKDGLWATFLQGPGSCHSHQALSREAQPLPTPVGNYLKAKNKTTQSTALSGHPWMCLRTRGCTTMHLKSGLLNQNPAVTGWISPAGAALCQQYPGHCPCTRCLQPQAWSHLLWLQGKACHWLQGQLDWAGMLKMYLCSQ